MDFIYWATCIIGLLIPILWYGIYVDRHFKRHGVKSAKRSLPFMGNMLTVFLGKQHLLNRVYDAYQEHPNERYFGFNAFNTPSVIIKDLELIKKITIKDFEHFVDHKVFMDEDADPLFGKNMFFLRGKKWKQMRLAMSPVYSSSKMKNMFSLILECADTFIDHFKELCQKEISTEKPYLEVEMKDTLSRLANDVIASTAFGVSVDSLKERNNEFYKMGKKSTNFSGMQFFKFFGYSACPKLMKFFGIRLFPHDVATFYRSLIKNAFDSREKYGTIRHDMIHLLMQAKKGSLINETEINNADDPDYISFKDSYAKTDSVKMEWTHDDLTAQAVAFLLAGFDATSSLLTFAAYELALNTDIQERLKNEIDEVVSNTNGQITFNELNKMEYLDMVVSETLRMWPPDLQLERVCVKPYELPLQNEFSTKTYTIKVGEDVWIPTYSIHHDPNNFIDHEKFIPERFSIENRAKMHPSSFIPFGAGPRMCIGARFAIMEAKAVIFKLLQKFDIVATPHTEIPVELATNSFALHSKNGIKLGLKLRTLNE